MFTVSMCPDLVLFFGGRKDGLQEWATYNPPGPTKPGPLNQVTHSLMLITHIYHFELNQVTHSTHVYNFKFPTATN